jgi:hypothetical protein
MADVFCLGTAVLFFVLTLIATQCLDRLQGKP